MIFFWIFSIKTTSSATHDSMIFIANRAGAFWFSSPVIIFLLFHRKPDADTTENTNIDFEYKTEQHLLDLRIQIMLSWVADEVVFCR